MKLQIFPILVTVFFVLQSTVAVAQPRPRQENPFDLQIVTPQIEANAQLCTVLGSLFGDMNQNMDLCTLRDELADGYVRYNCRNKISHYRDTVERCDDSDPNSLLSRYLQCVASGGINCQALYNSGLDDCAVDQNGDPTN